MWSKKKGIQFKHSVQNKQTNSKQNKREGVDRHTTENKKENTTRLKPKGNKGAKGIEAVKQQKKTLIE